MVTQPEAEAAYQAGDYSTAAHIYGELLAKEPNSSSLLRGYALSQGLLGNHTDALEAARKAAKIQPADPEVRYTLGYLLGLSGDHRAAVSELDTTLILKTNHVPARLALVASLVMDGEASETDDKEHAEQVLSRAYKMDQRNPATVNAYLQFLHRTGQRGKVVRELSNLDESIKGLAPLAAFVGKVKMDPQYQAIGGPASSTPISSVPIQPQVAMPPMGSSPQLFAGGNTADPLASGAAQPAAARPQPVITGPTGHVYAGNQAPQALATMPCPNCRQPIMAHAAICPHCNFQNRAVGTFAGRQDGPNHVWQEIAFNIICVIWGLAAAWDIVAWAQAKWEPGFLAVAGLFGVARVGMCIGLLFRNEFCGIWAKWVLYLNLFGTGMGFMISLFSGNIFIILLSAAMLGLTGFMLYLLNFVMGDY